MHFPQDRCVPEVALWSPGWQLWPSSRQETSQPTPTSREPLAALMDAPGWGCSGGQWPGFGSFAGSGLVCVCASSAAPLANLQFEWELAGPAEPRPGLMAEWSEPGAQGWQWPDHGAVGWSWQWSFSSHCGALWNVLGCEVGVPQPLLTAAASGCCCWRAFSEGSTAWRGSHQLGLQTEEFPILEKEMAKRFWSWSGSFHYCKN